MGNLNVDFLVEDRKPVRLLKPSTAILLAIGLTAAIVLLIAATIGLRPDVVAADPAAIVLVRSGTLLLLGLATLQALASSARPGVGSQDRGWKWILAVAGLFPLATLFSWLQSKPVVYAVAKAPSGIWCLGISLSAALLVGTTLTIWLRRGASVNIRRSGLLVGLAAGSFGTLCYSLYCPSNNVEYVGIWYGLSVTLSAIAGRFVVPRFIRW
jgi:hypothetical protein